MKNSKEYTNRWAKNNPDKVKMYRRENYLKNKHKWRAKYLRDYQSPEFKEKKLNERLRYMHKWKGEAFRLLGSKCIRCGFSDQRALQFDHIKGDGYIDNHKRNVTHYKKIVASVKAGENRYQVLCCNCNWIKRVENKEHFVARKDREAIVDKIRKGVESEVTLFSIQDGGSTLH